MNILNRRTVDYTEKEFCEIVEPLINREIKAYEKSKDGDGCIQMWFNNDDNLNVYRVNEDHVRVLCAMINDAGWKCNADIQLDERTGTPQLYIILFL